MASNSTIKECGVVDQMRMHENKTKDIDTDVESPPFNSIFNANMQFPSRLYLVSRRLIGITRTSHSNVITATYTATLTPGLLPALPVAAWPTLPQTPQLPQIASSSNETRLPAPTQNFADELPDDRDTSPSTAILSPEPQAPQAKKMALIVDKHRPRSLDDLTYHDELSQRLRSLVCRLPVSFQVT